MAEKPFFRRFFKPISRLLGSDDDDTPIPTVDDFDFDTDDIHQTLDDVLKQEAGRFATTLHVISLAGVREAVGPERWRKLSDKVQMIADSAIHRGLGPGGVYGRRGEDMFVLVFSRLTPREALARGQQIAKEVGERLLGSARFSAEGMVHCVEVDLESALAEDGELDLSALEAAVQDVREAEAATADGAARREELRRSLQPSNWQPPEPERRNFAASGPVEPPERRTFATAKPIEEASDAPVAAPVIEQEHGRYEIEVVPTWEGSTEAVSAHLCQLVRQDRPDAPELRGAAAYTGGTGVAFALDRLVATKVCELLRDLAKAQIRAVLIAPIHFSSLVTRQRMMITGIYADVPDGLRQLRLDFEVFGMPADVTARQITDVGSALKPLCRDVLLRLPPDSGSAAAALAADARYDGVGFDVAALPQDQRVDAMLLPRLAKLQSDAQENSLSAHVWGLRSRAAVRAAAEAGLGRFNGPALMRPLPRPRAPVAVPRQRFLEA